MRRRAHLLLAVVALAVVMATSGCVDIGATKAGDGRAPTTLHLATVESGDVPYRDMVSHFADEVFQRTDGAVALQIDWATVPWSPSSERELARRVRAGESDLALLPVRALSSGGATALDALSAPFLIESMELAHAVSASPVATDILDDLTQQGIIGLALVPEGLRHPVALGEGILTADQFDGLRIRTPQVDNDRSWNLLRALGAQPSSPVHYQASLVSGDIDAVESGYAWATDLPNGSVFTGNISFFTKFNVLAASPASLTRLDADLVDAIRDAATDAREYASENEPSEFERAASVCGLGMDVVLADDAEVRKLELAAAPLEQSLRRDAATARAIDAIRELEVELRLGPVTLPEICGPPTGDSARLPTP